jgi:hypothetical protein
MLAAVLMAVQACESPVVHRSTAPAVRDALLLWRVDLKGTDGPSETLEAITATQVKSRKAWRVTHYSPDPTASSVNEFDLYEVDAETFEPIRSVMQTSDFRLEISFGPKAALLRRVAKDGAVSVEEIRLEGTVMPEGPGNSVFLASLPLKQSFAMQYLTLDRWSGKGNSRLKRVDLKVTERKRITTPAGTREVFEVDARAEDNAFRILAYVRTEVPYYPVRMIYVRGTRTIESEVVAMAVDADH